MTAPVSRNPTVSRLPTDTYGAGRAARSVIASLLAFAIALEVWVR